MSSKAASFAGEREESDVSVQYTPPIHLLDHQHLSKSESDIYFPWQEVRGMRTLGIYLGIYLGFATGYKYFLYILLCYDNHGCLP